MFGHNYVRDVTTKWGSFVPQAWIRQTPCLSCVGCTQSSTVTHIRCRRFHNIPKYSTFYNREYIGPFIYTWLSKSHPSEFSLAIYLFPLLPLLLSLFSYRSAMATIIQLFPSYSFILYPLSFSVIAYSRLPLFPLSTSFLFPSWALSGNSSMQHISP